MNVIELANRNCPSELFRKISKDESIKIKQLLSLIKMGRVVIPANKNKKLEKPCAVGFLMRTKINANIGTSTDKPSLKEELRKLEIAVNSGADAVMDLSVGGDLAKIRKEIIAKCPVPLGTVPVYEVAVNAEKKYKNFLKFGKSEILDVLQMQAEQGVDFFTIHSGVTLKSVSCLKQSKRLLGIVSRGGAILAGWMKKNKKENPFFEYFDEILDIASKHDVTLSLGDGLRPGSILDATDNAQIQELKILGELAKRARKRNIQVMIEGPGHVPLDQIKKNMELEKKYCNNAPFYVLGPLVTDVAPGYDHITSAIGGAIAASFGADFLCYVTPSEHLRHPGLEDVKEGVIASRIAAHAADIVKKVHGAVAWDIEISRARRARNWKKQIELSIDPIKAALFRASSKPKKSDVCTMCGKYCSIKIMEECLRA